jgi:hypothetical protein
VTPPAIHGNKPSASIQAPTSSSTIGTKQTVLTLRRPLVRAPALQAASRGALEQRAGRDAVERRGTRRDARGSPVCCFTAKRLLVERLAYVLEQPTAPPALAGGHRLLSLGLLVGGARQGGGRLDPRAPALVVAVAHAPGHCAFLLVRFTSWVFFWAARERAKHAGPDGQHRPRRRPEEGVHRGEAQARSQARVQEGGACPCLARRPAFPRSSSLRLASRKPRRAAERARPVVARAGWRSVPRGACAGEGKSGSRVHRRGQATTCSTRGRASPPTLRVVSWVVARTQTGARRHTGIMGTACVGSSLCFGQKKLWDCTRL